MPPITFRRKLCHDGRSHFRLSIPKVLAEFIGIDPAGGYVSIEVDSENGRLSITKAKE